MGELESLIAQMEDLVRDKDGAEAAAEVARRDADALAAQIDSAQHEAAEAVRAAQTECEQLQAEVRAASAVTADMEEHQITTLLVATLEEQIGQAPCFVTCLDAKGLT